MPICEILPLTLTLTSQAFNGQEESAGRTSQNLPSAKYVVTVDVNLQEYAPTQNSCCDCRCAMVTFARLCHNSKLTLTSPPLLGAWTFGRRRPLHTGSPASCSRAHAAAVLRERRPGLPPRPAALLFASAADLRAAGGRALHD